MRDANTRPITAAAFRTCTERSIWIGLRDRNDDGTFALVGVLKLHVSGFPPCAHVVQSYVINALLLWLFREASSATVCSYHTDTDRITTRLNRNIWHQLSQIPVQGPFTFMWLMSRVFKAAHSSLKLYYHWFPWKHDGTFYYSQCFMGCLLGRSTEHLPRMCSQVKPLIKCRIPRNAGNNGKFSLLQVDVDWGLCDSDCMRTEEQWNIRFNWK